MSEAIKTLYRIMTTNNFATSRLNGLLYFKHDHIFYIDIYRKPTNVRIWRIELKELKGYHEEKDPSDEG